MSGDSAVRLEESGAGCTKSPLAEHRASSVFFGWYLVAAMMGLNVFVGGTLYYGFPVFFKAMLDEFHWSRAETALAYGVLQLEGGALAPLFGCLIDRWGTRGPLLIGTAVGAIGFLILSQTDSLAVFYTGFALAGLGFGAYWSAGLAATANWFREKRARAMGWVMVGYGLSGFLVPVLVWGVDAYGWRAVLVATAIGAIGLCLPLCLVVRHRPEPHGYHIDGLPPSSQAADVGDPMGARGRDISAPEALRIPAFWFAAAVYTTSYLPLAVVLPHMLTYLEEVGISGATAAFAITGLSVGSITGRIGGGYLGDLIDKRYVLAVAHLALSIGLLSLAFVSETWHLVLFLALVGPGYGATAPILPALVSDISGTRSFALIVGLTVVPGTIVWFVAPSLAGLVSDHFATYQPAWVATAIVTLIGAPLALCIRPDRRWS